MLYIQSIYIRATTVRDLLYNSLISYYTLYLTMFSSGINPIFSQGINPGNLINPLGPNGQMAPTQIMTPGLPQIIAPQMTNLTGMLTPPMTPPNMLNQKIHFFDKRTGLPINGTPFNGMPISILNPNISQHVTVQYKKNGFDVSLTGTQPNINQVVASLDEDNVEAAQSETQPTADRFGAPVYTNVIPAPTLPNPIGPFGTFTPNAMVYPSTSVHLYDQMTGKPIKTINTQIEQHVTIAYKRNGFDVTITGSNSNINLVTKSLDANETIAESTEGETIHMDSRVGPTSRNVRTVRPTISSTRADVNETKVENWIMVKSPANLSKYLLIYKPRGLAYSGSGILYIEKNYKNEEGREGPVLILGKTNRFNHILYEDMGGEIDKVIMEDSENVPIVTNAIKESWEESKLLLSVGIDAVDVSNYVDLQDEKHRAYYRCYIICITGTEDSDLQEMFTENDNSLRTLNDIPMAFNETTGIQRFYLEDVVSSMQRTTPSSFLLCNDVNGKPLLIRNRTVDIVRLASSQSKNIIEQAQQNCVTLTYKQESPDGKPLNIFA